VVVPIVAIVVLVALVGMVYGRDIIGTLTPKAAPASTPASQLVAEQAASATPADSATASSTAGAGEVARPTAARYVTPTPEPGGRTITLAPRSGEAGWWSAGDTRGSHLGDSFLYSGYYDDKAFVSAIRLDLRSVARGAPIQSGVLRMAGLDAERFNSDAGGNWSVQFLQPDAIEDLARTDFQKLFNAPSAITLFPELGNQDLQVDGVNSFALDANARDWLAQQIVNGVPAVIARVVGPVGGTPTLFAWDSGSGPSSKGNPPQLVLGLGPAPATPPPLPTQPVVVAVPTATPANVMTAAAYALEATRIVETVGTFTPMPANIVTPTPVPANLATAQAAGYREGLPPIVIYTPVPANKATAEANAAYATAVAVTTGTFTPVPANAVTPVVVAPTPRPENVMTAAAQSIAATAQTKREGTPTPLPYGAIIATWTPGAYIVIPTATPVNAATIQAQIAYATAVAVTTGTFTPMPPGAMTPTPTPLATPIPLIVYAITPRPTPSPTPGIPGQLPDAFRGRILFQTDREGSNQTYMLDPATGQLAWVTQAWPYALALAAEGRAPDGKRSVIVRNVGTGIDSKNASGIKTHDTVDVPQLIVLDSQYKVEHQITHSTAWSYDAAWSPKGDQIVYVSTEPGNDEIFAMDPSGENVKRLTNNTWEWDKHPSWSPDGSQIVFWSNRESGRRQLWIMSADGSNQRKLLDSAYNDWDPIWVK
jgi:hypothetical protein